MSVGRGKKRIFGAGILLLMTVLAVFTAVVFAAEGGSSGSYSLVIQKKFGDDTPAKAYQQTYTFKVNGEWSNQDGSKKGQINETVTLPRTDANGDEKWTYRISAEAPITATVTEVTSGVQVTEGGKDYNMGQTTCKTEALLKGDQTLQLKSNARITLSKPEQDDGGDLTTSWFHIENAPYPGHHELIKQISEEMAIVPGEEEKVFDNLPAGIYTIQELKAPDGYSVQVGPRVADVAAGDKGTFYINGNPGRLTITAGGTKGDGETHYYKLERTPLDSKDETKFETRTNRVNSGETWVIDDLPKGSYTVTEHTYGGQSGYTLTVPQSKLIRSRSQYSSALSETSSRAWKSFTASPEADYINLKAFGPLYDKNNKKLNATYGPFYYGVLEDGLISYWTYKGTFNSRRTTIDPPDALLEKDANGDKRVYFTAVNVTDTAAAKIGVEWEEYAYKTPEVSTITKAFGVSITKTVDGRGWMLFSKDADTSEGAENLTYTYKITSSDKKSVANCSITDANGNPLSGGMTPVNDYTVQLTLKPGESVKLNGLKKGTYSITETVNEDKADGFRMEVVGCAVNETEANTPYTITVRGPRTLTISKPACLEGTNDHGRIYTFKVTDSGGSPVSGMERLEVRAGEAIETDPLPMGGAYHIIPTNEMEPFRMTYTDSSSVNGLAQGKPGKSSATITFTNVFSTGDGSYRYIHEYYLKHADGSYTHEGSSPITHVRGLKMGANFQALDLTEEPNFIIKDSEGKEHNYTYTHFDEGYGIVDVPSAGGGEDITPETPPDTQEPPEASEPEADGDMSPADPEEPGADEQPDTPPDGDEDSGDDNAEPPEDDPAGADLPDEAVPYAGFPGLRASVLGSDGILSTGDGTEKNGSETRSLTYTADPKMSYASVTKEGTNIIILRYYREVPEDKQGTYKVVHEYYYRDDEGDHWEGASSITSKTGQLELPVPATSVRQINTFAPADGGGRTYTYEHDKRPQCGVVSPDESVTQSGYSGNPADGYTGLGESGQGYRYRPDTDKSSVIATEDGSQIIILRYYRDVKGAYNIVHEYYFRKQSTDVPEEGENPVEGDAENVPETGRSAMNAEMISVYDASSGGTLSGDEGYVYTLEGVSDIETIRAKLDTTHTGEEDDQRPDYSSRRYQYHSVVYGEKSDGTYEAIADKQWATATEDKDQIIILRYYREGTDPDNPPPEDPPDNPPPENPPDNPPPENPPDNPPPENPPDNPPPENPPDNPPPENPPDDPPPENPPEEPSYPTELPDPNDPDSPDEITIWEDGVPKTYVKVWDPENEEWIYVPEEDVPLWNRIPKTGDESNTALWAAAALASLGGLGVLAFTWPEKKRKL